TGFPNMEDQSARSARRARPLKRTALLAKPVNGINAPKRPDCLAGHVRFELRNVVANYPFESSRGFPGSEPNCGHGDHSRLSCSAGIRSSGLGSAGVFSKRSARTLAITRRRREGTNWPRSLSIRNGPAAAKPATPLLSLRWTLRAKRACVVITDAEPDRLALLTPPAPLGLRGDWSLSSPSC